MDNAIQRSLELLSDFYGFKSACVSTVSEARALTSLLKASLLGKQEFFSAKTQNGKELVLFLPANISLLLSYTAGSFSEESFPLKFKLHQQRYQPDASKEKENWGDPVEEWNLTTIGEPGPVAEAEIVQVLWQALSSNLNDPQILKLKVNATGCKECAPAFRVPFLAHWRSRANRLCRGCKKFLKSVPTKILLCSDEKCAQAAENAPKVLDFLCEACKKHLRGFLEFLDEIGVTYALDHKFFKEGTPYHSFIFEFMVDPRGGSGSTPEVSKTEMNSVAGVVAEGGRISRAGELITGKYFDAVSGTIFGNAVATLCAQNLKQHSPCRIFLAQLGDLAKRKSFLVLEMLRSHGMDVQQSLGRDAVKSQLKIAERLGAKITLILGQKEVLDDTIIVREMESGIQETIPQDKLIEVLKKKLKG